MTRRWRLSLPDSIFSRALLLVFASVLLVTVVNAGIILLRSPPIDAPLTASEIARLLVNKPIAKDASVRRMVVTHLSLDLQARTSPDPVAHAIAQRLGLPLSSVRMRRGAFGMSGPAWLDRQIDREFAIYAGDGDFNPAILGPFSAAVRRQDGKWLLLTSTPTDALTDWRQSIIIRFLLTWLVVLPIAWLFARRLAKPIRSFAEAAEHLGRRRQAELVPLEGPTEIQQATRALNEMQMRLQNYLTERMSMVGAIAHDLRTPLSRLHFHVAKAPDEVRCRAEAEIKEMEGLIAATLDYVHHEARPRLHEPVDLRLLIEGVVDDFADLGHDVTMGAVQPATVIGDPILLKRLFSNLISNAVTYGGQARASIGLRNGAPTVDIVDDGPGLSPHDLERVFEPFYRAEASRNRSTGGMGLGLAIVDAAATAHGGEVSLCNRPEGGLCASVSLPLWRMNADENGAKDSIAAQRRD